MRRLLISIACAGLAFLVLTAGAMLGARPQGETARPHSGLFDRQHLLGLRFGLSARAVSQRWGIPTSVRTRPYSLIVNYPMMRLFFASFDEHPSASSTTLLEGVHVTSAAFHTSRGVRVGMSLRSVRAANQGGRYDRSKATFWFEYHNEGPGGAGALIGSGRVVELFVVQSI